METGCGVAVQCDPTKWQHGEELDCHEPGKVMGCNECGEAEEEGLHEVGEGELEVDVFDVLDESGNDDAAEELTCSMMGVSDVSLYKKEQRRTYPDGRE